LAVERSKACSFESLEGRRLLTAGAALGTDGVLRVLGTEVADQIVVARVATKSADVLRVRLNGAKSYFPSASVKKIEIAGEAGDDRVSVEGVACPILLEGGNGHDSLTGSAGTDTLDGGLGDDEIAGGVGNDVLVGGLGDDTLLGGKGDDGLWGGPGGDTLTDRLGDNQFGGGGGQDVIKKGTTLPDRFLIGVWGQRGGTSWKWKMRGLNTMVAAETMGGRVTVESWDEEVAQNGMLTIRQPTGNPEYDLSQKNLIAWLAPDEPDVHHTDPEQTGEFYRRMKKIAPDKPVFMNFSGGHVVGYQERNWKHPYKEWTSHADWISSDIYPVTGWNLPERLGLVGESIDRLEYHAPGKPQFAFIEASNQMLPWVPNSKAASPGQFRAMIWNAVIHGARGIFYFPQTFKPKFEYEMIPPKIERQMKIENARLNALSPVLMSRIEPKGYGFEAEGVEGTWRVVRGKKYFIVLNRKGKGKEDVRMKLTGVKDGTAKVLFENRTVEVRNGEIVDDFLGFESQVYVVD
jgi:hypothetical protein